MNKNNTEISCSISSLPDPHRQGSMDKIVLWSQGEENKKILFWVWKLEEQLCGRLSDTNWFCCLRVENSATCVLDPQLQLQVTDSLGLRAQSEMRVQEEDGRPEEGCVWLWRDLRTGLNVEVGLGSDEVLQLHFLRCWRLSGELINFCL